MNHFEHLLSIEQAFRNVQSLSVHDRDAHAQRASLLDALDAISAVRPPDFDDLCKLSVAQKALAEAEAELDPVAADVLAQGSQRGAGARGPQECVLFALAHHRIGPSTPGQERRADRPLRRGGWHVPARPAQLGARLRRSRRGGRRTNRVLLASHNGLIPANLPDLAYLYLLRLLAQPKDLRGSLPSIQGP